MGKKFNEKKRELMKNPEFRKEYNNLEPEFTIARALIKARARSGLTQQEVAKRMGTTQSAVARLERGHPLPSITSLKKYASATNSKLNISLVPVN
jgi:DNA-binding XRE family transcriptional regulator